MRNKQIIGAFYNTSSKIHDLTPLCKIVCFLLYIFLFAIAKNAFTGLLLVGFVFLLICFSHVPMKVYILAIWQMKFLIFFLIIFQLFLSISLNDTLLCLFSIIGIMFYSALISSTTKVEDLTKGLEQFLSPLKIVGIKVHRFAFTISLSIRFIPMILEQGNQILKSLSARGMDFSHSTGKQKIYILKALVIPLFAKTITSAEDFSRILTVRLYQIDKKRTSLNEKKYTVFDLIYSSLHIVLCIVIMEVL